MALSNEPILDVGSNACRLLGRKCFQFPETGFIDNAVDISRGISGEVFNDTQGSSELLRICNFVAEQFPPYKFQNPGPVTAEQVDELIVFYFRSQYSVVPIVEERDVRTLFAKFSSETSTSPAIKAIIFAIAALSANSRKYGASGEYFCALGEWCYGYARHALSDEPNDAQFEYLLAATLLVCVLAFAFLDFNDFMLGMVL